MGKTIYCIRHGYALHNKLFNYIGKQAYSEFRDTPLLHEGILQAKNVCETWEHIDDVELVLVSPCSRTLDTAKHIFKNKSLIALDCLIEYPLGIEICNRRKDVDDLKFIHPNVNFNEISQNTFDWPDEKETINHLNIRVHELLKWINKRHEKTIVIVGHSSWIGQFMNSVIGDENNELKHCYPYKVEMDMQSII